MSTTLGPEGLLEYNTTYGVLICLKCQYAIQKSAVESHLLRHKIYRDERQRLLATIAQLNLLEPQEVVLPSPSSQSVSGLPIISGFRCTVGTCGVLYASSKRMRRHHVEEHGTTNVEDIDSSTRQVQLQTFFRGIKIKYFEIASPLASNVEEEPRDSIQSVQNGRDGNEKRDEETQQSAMVIDPQEVSQTSVMDSSSLLTHNLNLEVLGYLHHFTMTTSITLPSPDREKSSIQYWQVYVVDEALQHKSLMYGILALSACHLAAQSTDQARRRAQCEHLAAFISQCDFANSQQGTSRPDSETGTAGTEAGVKAALGQILGILQCKQWSLPRNPQTSHALQMAGVGRIECLFALCRTFVASEAATDSLNEYSSFTRASEVGRGLLASHSAFATTIEHLNSLPHLMAVTLGEPENAEDAMTALMAVATLIECCAISFAGSHVSTVFYGMAMWVVKVPDRFHLMVTHRHSAAFIVLSHWVVFLVKRAEDCGCWFLKGMTEVILYQVAEDPIIWDLVKDFWHD